MKKNIVVLTGAGISAESGIRTFRDSNGLWEEHDVMEVASPRGFARNPELVLRFYNQRRAQLHQCQPNAGHLALTRLQEFHHVHIVTQNVDDLHERAGNKNIMHLHGELLKARSTGNPSLVYDWPGDINLGDVCEQGFQLRPHIVWFGEAVPLFEAAADLCEKADVMLIVGTSMLVNPANTLVDHAPFTCPVFVIDPSKPAYSIRRDVTYLTEPASTGVPKVVEQLISEAGK